MWPPSMLADAVKMHCHRNLENCIFHAIKRSFANTDEQTKPLWNMTARKIGNLRFLEIFRWKITTDLFKNRLWFIFVSCWIFKRQKFSTLICVLATANFISSTSTKDRVTICLWLQIYLSCTTKDRPSWPWIPLFSFILKKKLYNNNAKLYNCTHCNPKHIFCHVQIFMYFLQFWPHVQWKYWKKIWLN